MSEFPFDDMITDLIRAAQNVATETEWGGGTKSAEKLLERTEHDLLDAIIALQKRAAELEAKNKRLREALERFAKIDLTGPIGDAIAWDILNARAVLKGGEE